MRAVSWNSVHFEVMRNATGASFMCCSFLPNMRESGCSVSVALRTVWLFSTLPLVCGWGRGGPVLGDAVIAAGPYICVFKESLDWHLSWKLPTWISMQCSPKYCWLLSHWRKKGSKQFAVWHWGKDSWQGQTTVTGPAFWVWVWFGLFVLKGAPQRHVLGRSLSFISYPRGRNHLWFLPVTWKLRSVDFFFLLFSSVWKKCFNFLTLLCKLQ